MATVDERAHAGQPAEVLWPIPSVLVPPEDDPDTMELNLGPNHPSTHGVLRLVATLSGENVVGLRNELGYVHTGIEKNMEYKTYWKAITYAVRADYNAFFSNELVFVAATEKLLGLEVPRRAEWIRALFQELVRIHNHLIMMGTGSMDLGGIALLFYGFRERDRTLDLFELATGVRMHDRYAQVGGVAEDLPAGFDAEARKYLAYMRDRLDEYEEIIGAQPIFRDRTVGVGVVTPEFARQMGLTGPNARASGVDWDLRVHMPYGAYRELGVRTVLRRNGDTYDRYLIRLDEMRQSLDLIERILDGLPPGPWIADDRKVVLPPRHELHTSMESLIHHFKLVTEGFRVPAGEVYYAVEGPRGELGCHLVADGTARPWRVHFRSASLVALQSVAALCRGVLIADLIAILASLDPNMGDCDR
ncbi:MAG TPA: NADH-quinone oxidoreductase subunit D [Solirubrobacteraceae bacterium]|nr:NADH-quinone oxidoreductase subunit D [Solirubrobacteraceae bacterium]